MPGSVTTKHFGGPNPTGKKNTAAAAKRVQGSLNALSGSVLLHSSQSSAAEVLRRATSMSYVETVILLLFRLDPKLRLLCRIVRRTNNLQKTLRRNAMASSRSAIRQRRLLSDLRCMYILVPPSHVALQANIRLRRINDASLALFPDIPLYGYYHWEAITVWNGCFVRKTRISSQTMYFDRATIAQEALCISAA